MQGENARLDERRPENSPDSDFTAVKASFGISLRRWSISVSSAPRWVGTKAGRSPPTVNNNLTYFPQATRPVVTRKQHICLVCLSSSLQGGRRTTASPWLLGYERKQACLGNWKQVLTDYFDLWKRFRTSWFEWRKRWSRRERRVDWTWFNFGSKDLSKQNGEEGAPGKSWYLPSLRTWFWKPKQKQALIDLLMLLWKYKH